MHYLYRITNQLNNKVYIGQTIDEKKRWTRHKYYARTQKSGQYIHNAMSKHGIENFTYETIAVCVTQEKADETEMQLIQQYDSRNPEKGYNLSPGGDGSYSKTPEFSAFMKEWHSSHPEFKIERSKKIKQWHAEHPDHRAAFLEAGKTSRVGISPWNKIEYTQEQIQEIKTKRLNGQALRSLAREYNVDRLVIKRILKLP